MCYSDVLLMVAIIGIWGIMLTPIIKRYMKNSDDKDIEQAVKALKHKGFNVTFDRISGFDEETQKEMELARSGGYTVLDIDNKAIKL